MFASLSLPPLILIFGLAALAVWIAGVRLSETADVLSMRLHLGEALGGLILLAFATNLPEIAITLSAALAHNLDIAVGNILGGIAIQTVVLVILDVWGAGSKETLTYKAASLGLVLEGVLVVALLAVVAMGAQLPGRYSPGGLEPAAIAIAVVWFAGLYLIGKARTDLPWQERGVAPGGQEKPRGHKQQHKESKATERKVSTTRATFGFAIAAAVTLVGGVLLERSGEQIALHIGMNGAVFGATILAAATALPEVSTGIEAVRLGDYQLAVSDIFGGNAFLTILFPVAAIVSGAPILARTHEVDLYLTALGALLTTVYICGLIFRPRRMILRMGIDSLVVLIVYALGILGLFGIVQA